MIFSTNFIHYQFIRALMKHLDLKSINSKSKKKKNRKTRLYS